MSEVKDEAYYATLVNETYQPLSSNLYNAVRVGNLRDVQYFMSQERLKKRKKQFLTDDKKRSPLHVAASRGFVDIVRYFLSGFKDTAYGALTAQCDRGHTPLMKALKNNHADVIFELVDKKYGREHILMRDKLGMTALHIAASKSCGKKVVEALLDAGVRVNVKDDKGNVPLMYAVSSIDYDMIELLIKKGGNALVKNNEQIDALTFANQVNPDTAAHASTINSFVEKYKNVQPKLALRRERDKMREARLKEREDWLRGKGALSSKIGDVAPEGISSTAPPAVPVAASTGSSASSNTSKVNNILVDVGASPVGVTPLASAPSPLPSPNNNSPTASPKGEVAGDDCLHQHQTEKGMMSRETKGIKMSKGSRLVPDKFIKL